MDTYGHVVTDDQVKDAMDRPLKTSPSGESTQQTLWGGRGSNPRPKDYESSALTD